MIKWVLETEFNFYSSSPQGYGRTAESQAGYQLLGIASTVAFAIVGGLITGLFLRSPSVRRLEKEKLHDDEDAWEVPA